MTYISMWAHMLAWVTVGYSERYSHFSLWAFCFYGAHGGVNHPILRGASKFRVVLKAHMSTPGGADLVMTKSRGQSVRNAKEK
jgi:hypothetical protein